MFSSHFKFTVSYAFGCTCPCMTEIWYGDLLLFTSPPRYVGEHQAWDHLDKGIDTEEIIRLFPVIIKVLIELMTIHLQEWMCTCRYCTVSTTDKWRKSSPTIQIKFMIQQSDPCCCRQWCPLYVFVILLLMLTCSQTKTWSNIHEGNYTTMAAAG